MLELKEKLALHMFAIIVENWINSVRYILYIISHIILYSERSLGMFRV